MKKLIVTLSTAVALLLIGATDSEAAATSHSVTAGDSLYKISQKYNIPVEAIQKVNNKKSSLIYPGETIKIPTSISDSEKDLLARLVRAEAEGESYAGKVAVAVVVLNRVDHPDFPNTVREVIEEVTPTGHYAFSPFLNGEIDKPADAESKRAVSEAIAFRGQGQGSLFFYNPVIATNHWNATRTETIRIGNHVFSK
ncbi:LysM peptidoglycan-binding domain-containing protein [bacterium LRH843]|nr:LysM peptidoglycan-binding domain-containing protein [bacterium LRH843]